jgi:hypothetical protein
MTASLPAFTPTGRASLNVTGTSASVLLPQTRTKDSPPQISYAHSRWGPNCLAVAVLSLALLIGGCLAERHHLKNFFSARAPAAALHR